MSGQCCRILLPGQCLYHIVLLSLPCIRCIHRSGVVLLCLLLSFFFAEAERKQVFVSLIAGSSLHLFLDLFQKHLQPGYTLLFPFSWRAFEFSLLWPETIVSMVPLWILIIGVMALLNRLNKEKF